MSETVYYHLPNAKRFSLDFINPDFGKVEDQAEDYDQEIEIREYDLNQTVYALYSASSQPEVAEELDYDFEEEIQQMVPHHQTITVQVLQLFQTILDETYEEEERRLEAYKQVEINDIPNALSHVDWRGTVPDVGGNLLSSLILKHTLPNANHRTSLALLELYIQAHEYEFDLPDMATSEFEWKNWVNDYICDSKRLLTVRRNSTKFKYLWEWGCKTVERKDGIQILLEEYALDVQHHKAYEYYADEHNKLCVELTKEILRREGHGELNPEPGMTSQQFAERLQNMP